MPKRSRRLWVFHGVGFTNSVADAAEIHSIPGTSAEWLQST